MGLFAVQGDAGEDVVDGDRLAAAGVGAFGGFDVPGTVAVIQVGEGVFTINVLFGIVDLCALAVSGVADGDGVLLQIFGKIGK